MDRSIRLFKSKRIPVFEPGEEEYERSVATANMLFRFARPDCVVQPETHAHVQQVVKQARARGQKITIKCGGHSYAGHSTADKGISMDLKRLNSVKLDMRERKVVVGGGCTWGDVYKVLVNGKHDGFVVNGGRCPFVGVGGFLLGGGLGPFTRGLGLGCDTLREATVVTAEGELVTVRDTDEPGSDAGRLFWALCGAGGGNFGVVVQMKLDVLRLANKAGNVVAGRYTWFPRTEEEKRGFKKTMDEFYAVDWPREMTIDTTWLCDLRDKGAGGQTGVRFIIYFDGEADEYQHLIAKHIKDKELRKQLSRRILPEKSTRFLHETLVEQWSEETVKAFPSNRSYSVYSSFSFPGPEPSTGANEEEEYDEGEEEDWESASETTNSPSPSSSAMAKATSIIEEEMAAFRTLFASEAVSFLATFIHVGGRAADRDPRATAFPWRDAGFQAYITAEWNDKWMERDMRGFLGRAKKKLRPFSLGGGTAAFVNFPDGMLLTATGANGGVNGGGGYEGAYWGVNVDELRRVKEVWDRDEFWNGVQGVRLLRDVEGRARGDGLRGGTGTGTTGTGTRGSGDGVGNKIGNGGANPSADTDGVERGNGNGNGIDVDDDEALTDSIARKQWEFYEPLDIAAALDELKDFVF